MDVTNAFVGLRVSNREDAVAWYTRFLGQPPLVLPNDAEALWHLADAATFYVVEDGARAGHGIAALVVPDLEATLAGRPRS